MRNKTFIICCLISLLILFLNYTHSEAKDTPSGSSGKIGTVSIRKIFEKSKKYNEICLHSQTYISDFYKKCGFKTRGEIFLEADIEHVEMYMNIRS